MQVKLVALLEVLLLDVADSAVDESAEVIAVVISNVLGSALREVELKRHGVCLGHLWVIKRVSHLDDRALSKEVPVHSDWLLLHEDVVENS